MNLSLPTISFLPSSLSSSSHQQNRHDIELVKISFKWARRWWWEERKKIYIFYLPNHMFNRESQQQVAEDEEEKKFSCCLFFLWTILFWVSFCMLKKRRNFLFYYHLFHGLAFTDSDSCSPVIWSDWWWWKIAWFNFIRFYSMLSWTFRVMLIAAKNQKLPLNSWCNIFCLENGNTEW